MKVPLHLPLYAGHGTISDPFFGLSIQRYPDGKASGRAISEDLNAGNGLASWPLPYGFKAFVSKGGIVQSNRFKFRHGEVMWGKILRIETSHIAPCFRTQSLYRSLSPWQLQRSHRWAVPRRGQALLNKPAKIALRQRIADEYQPAPSRRNA